MKVWIFVTWCLASMSCGVFANGVEHTIKVETCQFMLTDPFHAEVSMPRQENNFSAAGYSATIRTLKSGVRIGFGFDLACNSSDEPGSSLARFDPKTQLWTKDLDARFSDMTPSDRKLLDKATSVLNVKSVNASGFVAIEEETTGDEAARRRSMSFCLFHSVEKICGRGGIGRLEDGPKGNMTPYALEIIKSIEFLDDVSPSTAN